MAGAAAAPGHPVTPWLLDLFGCEGGAADGYARAGWRVVSIDRDLRRLRHNPHSAVCGDVFALAPALLASGRFSAVHASPPCQLFTRTKHLARAQGHPSGDAESVDYIARTRSMLRAAGLPYVIENVPGAPLFGTLTLCGSQFGLSVQRHRVFESNVALLAPGGCRHDTFPEGKPWGVYGSPNDAIPNGGRTARNVAHALEVMGVTRRMTWRGVTEAIPPAFTEAIGWQLREHLERAA